MYVFVDYFKCKGCGNTGTMFYKPNKSKNPIGHCKVCYLEKHREYKMLWYAKNKEEYNEKRMAHYHENKEEISKKRKQERNNYSKKRIEKIKEYARIRHILTYKSKPKSKRKISEYQYGPRKNHIWKNKMFSPHLLEDRK